MLRLEWGDAAVDSMCARARRTLRSDGLASIGEPPLKLSRVCLVCRRPVEELPTRVFCLLVRYRALQGGGVHGGGFQAAITADVCESIHCKGSRQSLQPTQQNHLYYRTTAT